MRRFLTILAAVSVMAAYAYTDKIDLGGTWNFRYGDMTAFTDSISLPGSMLTNGKGNDVDVAIKWTGSLYDYSYYYADSYAPYRLKDNIKFPFFLTPDKEYVGDAWYRKNVDIPEDWKDKRVMLYLERPHIETFVRVNGKDAGHRMSLSVPHEFDITDFVKPGNKNEIEIRVYNGIENVCVGADSHSVTDQTQGNWNGIVGEISLRSTPKDTYIDMVRVFPDVKNRKADVMAIVKGENKSDISKSGTAVAFSNDGKQSFFGELTGIHGDTLHFVIPMGENVQLWSEFTPENIYTLKVSVGEDSAYASFGMRDITVKGKDILINGRPAYMRGTVDCCCFPLTGYPPTDVQSWTVIFEKCKEYGINMIRFHSYCPPEAAFTAADNIGIYLQPEGPSWPNHGVKLNAGMSIDQYLLDEGRRMLDTYGNHPSFVMMAAGNEPAGNWTVYTDRWVAEMKEYDSSKIYCGASVGGGWAWDAGSEFHVKGGGRGLVWNDSAPSSDDDYSKDISIPRNFKPSLEHPENNSPIIAHEQGQWCAFPDLSETSRYVGPYKARNFEIFKDLLEKNGMKDMDRRFLNVSGKLQTLCYKYEIERNLRTPGYSGFQLLGLNDYSGQGSAIVGVLNVFWREKGYVNGTQWREFCSEVVPLAKFPKFVFTEGEKALVPVEVINASSGALHDVEAGYSILDAEGKVIASGTFNVTDIQHGKNNLIGEVNLPIFIEKEPVSYTLSVKIGDKGCNSWQYWVYPDEMPYEVPSGIYKTDILDNKALKVLDKGGSVLISAAGKVSLGSDITQHYLPVFWNTSWFKMRPPHATGAYIDSGHPLFAHGFPTDDWGNLNWWELLNKAQVINLIDLPSDYQSPVQPIDTWHLSRKLGMIVEAKVLNGKILVTTIDIDNDLGSRPVARRMRNAILDYMASRDFNPSLMLAPDTVKDFFTKQTPPVEMFTEESPDELKPKVGS